MEIMDPQDIKRNWDSNAELWTLTSREGFQVSRDVINMPSFLRMLPDVNSKRGLDIGCGDGHSTRLVAQKGAIMSAIDISDKFIAYAKNIELEESRGIDFRAASVHELPFPDKHFDFAMSVMCFMGIPDHSRAFEEIYRVLKPGGFLQFSITHPCFDTPIREPLFDEQHRPYAFKIGDYFHNLNGEVAEWTFRTAPKEIKQKYPLFKIPRYNRTLSQWLNLVIEAGFTIKQLEEPSPSAEDITKHPHLREAQLIGYFLQVRAQKA